MKVKDLSQPLLSGRMGNLIYYVRNGVQCVRRAEVPGKNGRKNGRISKRSDRTFRHRTGFLCGLLPPSVTGYLAGSCQGGRKNGAQPVQLDELPVFQRRGEACGFRQFYFYEGVPAFAKGIEDRTGWGDREAVPGELAGRARMGHSNRERPPANRCIVRFPAVRTTAGSERIGQAAGFVRRIHTVGTGNRRRTRVLLFCPRRRKRLFGLSIFPDQCHPLSSTAYNMNVMKWPGKKKSSGNGLFGKMLYFCLQI